MSDSSSTPSSPSPCYSPPPELVAAAERDLRAASPRELALAATAYAAYGIPTGGRSAVTGAELPRFEHCSPLVRAGWLSVVYVFDAAPLVASPSDFLSVNRTVSRPETSRPQQMSPQLYTVQPDEDADEVDSFILGIRDLAAAAKDLAEASQLTRADGPIDTLIETLASALTERVKALAPTRT